MSTIQLSERVQRVKPSATIAVSTLAREMRAAGRDVLSLSAGEPDFDTPAHVCAAAVEAMEAGDTRYTAADGTPALKRAICNKFERDNGLDFELAEISVGAGAKQVLYNVCAALLNPGDEAIILAPYWVSYPDIVKLCDGEPVIVSAGLEDNYKVTPEQIEDAINRRQERGGLRPVQAHDRCLWVTGCDRRRHVQSDAGRGLFTHAHRRPG